MSNNNARKLVGPNDASKLRVIGNKEFQETDLSSGQEKRYTALARYCCRLLNASIKLFFCMHFALRDLECIYS